MKKKLLATVLAMTMALTPMSVQAQEVESMRYTFTAMDNLIVTIPSSLDLTYEYGTFKGQDTVTVQGMKSDTKEYSVDISLDSTDIVYTNQTDGVSTVNGVVSLGENGTESWSADEVASGVSKDISIIVIDTLETEGTYKGAFNYDITVNTTNLVDDGYFTATVNEDGTTCTITGLTDLGKAWVVENSGVLAIPEMRIIDGKKYTVNAVGASAFASNTDIIEVITPDTLVSLDERIFEGCTNLKSCQLSDNISSMGTCLFQTCSSLTTVNVPINISTLPTGTFNQCSSLKNIIIPNNVTSFGDAVFQACSSLTDITLPAYMTDLGSYTFNGCGSLTNIILPSGLTYIDIVAFQRSGLTSIEIPEGVEYIDQAAFLHCDNLSEVILPEGLQEIKQYAFEFCNIKNLVIPNSCKMLRNGAFSFSNSSLESLTIPVDCDFTDRTTTDITGSVQNPAFYKSCSNLKYITITKGTTASSLTLTSTTYKYSPWYYSSYKVNMSFEEGVTTINNRYCQGCYFTNLVIPSTVTSIGAYAFNASYCNNLYWNPESCSLATTSFKNIGSRTGCKLYLGDTVRVLPVALTRSTGGDYGTKGINSVSWGNSPSITLGDYAFNTCPLQELILPESITVIPDYAFAGTKISSLTLHDKLTSIGLSAFASCTSLNDIYYDSYSASLSGSGTTMAFKSAGSDSCTFHFGTSFVNNNIETVPTNLIGNSGGNNPSNIRYIDWGEWKPKSLSNAFYYSNIYELYIPDSVTSIDEKAFQGTTSLRTVHIPKSIVSIGTDAFKTGTSTVDTIYYAGTEEYRLANLDITNSGGAINSATWIYEEDGAKDTDIFSVVYDEINSTCLIKGFNTYGKSKIKELNGILTIPNQIVKNGVTYTATAISDSAFKDNTDIVSISIADTVITIGASAFSGCTGVREVDFSNMLETIGDEAFLNCTSLTNIVIPDTVMSIGSACFSGCSSLASAQLPNSITILSKQLFKDCTSLTSIVIPDSITDVGSSTTDGEGQQFYGCTSLSNVTLSSNMTVTSRAMFSGCKALTNITLPDGLLEIGYNTFYSVPITEINIPDTVTKIDNQAFYGTSLTSIEIPASVIEIGALAFDSCKSLASVTLNEGLEKFGNHVFENCSALESISIPKTVTTFGVNSSGNSGLFYNATSLKYVYLPKSITNVPPYAFYGCSSLETVDYEGEYSDREAMIIGSNNDPLLNAEWIYAGKRSRYDIDGLNYDVDWVNMTAVCNGLSENNTSATTITIPSSIITNNATFAVKSVGANAFSGNTNITSVVIEEGVEKLGYYAFQGCTNLQTAQLADSISDMGNATVSNATNGGTTFWNCSSLTSVNIPAGLSVIPRSCFGNCSSLTSITIPDTVTEIGYQGFYSSGLTSVSIPENTIIDARAFMNCKSLKTVDMAESVYLAGTTAESDTNGKQFYGCTALTSITIPSGNPIVPGNAFLKCSALNSVTISEGVTTLGWATFAECSKMTDIYIPSTLTTVIKWCFNSDNALKTVHYNGTAESKASISVGSRGNTKFTGAAWEYAVEATTLSLRDEEPVYEIVAFDEPVQMIVTEESTLVSEPEGEITAELQADEILLVYGTVTKDGLETDWLYAENEEEYCGFIDKKFVAEYVPAPVYELVPYDEPVDMLVLDDAVLVDEPEGEVLTELEKDSILKVLGGITIDGLESEWVYTELEDETIGMIEKSYLSEEVEIPTPSPSATPTPSETPTASETPTPSETPIPSETPTPSAVPTEEPTAEPTQSPEETLIVIEDITNSQQSNESSSSEPVVLQEGGVPLNEDTDIDTSVLDYLPTEEEDLLVDQEIE